MKQKTMVRTPDSFGDFLKEAARYPLLTPEDEIELGKKIQDGQQASAKLKASNDLSIEEVRMLKNTKKTGELAAKKMVLSNIRLVVNISKKYQNRGMELLDLIQEGTIGLQRAAEKFDYKKGYKFSTYGYWWIRQAITRSIGDKSRPVRLPVHINEKLNKVKKINRKLAEKLGRMPTQKELSEAVYEADPKITPEILRDLMAKQQQTISLSQPCIKGEEDSNDIEAMLADASESPWMTAECEEISEAVCMLLEKLNDREQIVIRMRYGFEDGQRHSLEAVGHVLGVTRERVRQIEHVAMRRLRVWASRECDRELLRA